MNKCFLRKICNKFNEITIFVFCKSLIALTGDNANCTTISSVKTKFLLSVIIMELFEKNRS